MLILYDVNTYKYLLKSTDYYSLNLELRMILSTSIEIYFVILIKVFVVFTSESIIDRKSLRGIVLFMIKQEG